MTIVTEGVRTADFLISEANGYRSRETGTVTLPSGGLVAGTVLGKITATGKYVLHDVALSNGAEDAAAILYTGSGATGDEVMTLITRDAEVNEAHLTFKSGISAPNKALTITALATLGIIARKGE